jgi:hypothetical protein
MPNQPTSFRYPFSLPAEIHPGVRNALRLTYNGVKDLNDAIRKLNQKVNTNTETITNVTNVAAAPAVTPPPAPPPLIQLIQFTLTSAQVLALKATPVQILSAPGAGAMYLVGAVVYQYKFVTTPYTVNGSGNQYLCVYAGTQPALATLGQAYVYISSTGFMDQGASQLFQGAGLARAAQTVLDNGALFVSLPSDATAELLAGDGTLTVSAEYATVALQ